MGDNKLASASDDSLVSAPQVDNLTEDLLREANALSLWLLRNELVCTYLIQDNHFRYVNPRFAQLIGYT